MAHHKDVSPLNASALSPDHNMAGCVFAKSDNLPHAIIDYNSPTGAIPTDALKHYGELTLLAARELDSHNHLLLRHIGGNAWPAEFGSLTLAGPALTALAAPPGAPTALSLMALLRPSNPQDPALYTAHRLRTLKHARTRVRLHLEQQADGLLKGYGFNTQDRRDWEMVPVITFSAHDQHYVADLGADLNLIWTPAKQATAAENLPRLEHAPRTPHIWVFPPRPAADEIIGNPIYPPAYRDFILVFPAEAATPPLYALVNLPGSQAQRSRPLLTTRTG